MPSLPQHTYKILSCKPRPAGSGKGILSLRTGCVMLVMSCIYKPATAGPQLPVCFKVTKATESFTTTGSQARACCVWPINFGDEAVSIEYTYNPVLLPR